MLLYFNDKDSKTSEFQDSIIILITGSNEHTSECHTYVENKQTAYLLSSQVLFVCK